jgi:hypothetical protein
MPVMQKSGGCGGGKGDRCDVKDTRYFHFRETWKGVGAIKDSNATRRLGYYTYEYIELLVHRLCIVSFERKAPAPVLV